MSATDGRTVLLHELAHARAGDKGNHCNICVFAYRHSWYPLLVEQLTEERVAKHFAHRQPSAVHRYLLPRLEGMNFVLENVLDGGVNESLNLDMHGKSLSFLLLAIPIQLPPGLLGSDHPAQRAKGPLSIF
jgi:hypothetical protein